jgi:hypothetical protein
MYQQSRRPSDDGPRECSVSSGVLNEFSEVRAEPRDEVHYRTRATRADRRSLPVTVVNLSANGLMIRSDTDIAVGETIKVQLPVAGQVEAVVRWALGGRAGCQLSQAIPPALYHSVLALMRG